MLRFIAISVLAMLPVLGCVVVGAVAGDPPVHASDIDLSNTDLEGLLQNTGMRMEEAFNSNDEIVPMNSDICLGKKVDLGR